MCFPLLYRIYLTGVGRMMHDSALNKVRTNRYHPHVKYSQKSNAPEYLYEDGNLQVIPVPLLEDNLAYIVLWKPTGKNFLVDPADIDAVEEVKTAYNIEGAPECILCTHKHWDHAGHNGRFAERY